MSLTKQCAIFGSPETDTLESGSVVAVMIFVYIYGQSPSCSGGLGSAVYKTTNTDAMTACLDIENRFNKKRGAYLVVLIVSLYLCLSKNNYIKS